MRDIYTSEVYNTKGEKYTSFVIRWWSRIWISSENHSTKRWRLYSTRNTKDYKPSYDNNIRKWIHRFNEKGVEGIISKIHTHKSIKFTDKVEKQIIEIATRNPRKYYGLPFSTWSLRILAGFRMKEMKLVDRISHTEIRNILLKHEIKWRQSKMVMGHSQDPEYNIKKVHWTTEIWYTSGISLVISRWKRTNCSKNIYGETSWSQVQSKIERAQKINGILNVFGVYYNHTNDQMYTHSYRKKTGKQFLDFIKTVDRKYNASIKQIFLILDNISIHRSKKVRDTIQKYYPKINLIFLPTRSPELNLIEVRWMWMQRQVINNSTFENECDIGKAVRDWTRNYNKNMAKQS